MVIPQQNSAESTPYTLPYFMAFFKKENPPARI